MDVAYGAETPTRRDQTVVGLNTRQLTDPTKVAFVKYVFASSMCTYLQIGIEEVDDEWDIQGGLAVVL